MFTSLIIIVLVLFYWPKDKICKNYIAGISDRIFIIIVTLLIALFTLPDRTKGRLARLIFQNEALIGGRGDIWAYAFGDILTSPFIGHGLGHYSNVYFPYPHNLFLQVGMDSGFIGIFIILVVVAWPLVFFAKKFMRRLSCAPPLAVGYISAYTVILLEYCKSGDFYLARNFFMIGGVLVGYLANGSKYSNDFK